MWGRPAGPVTVLLVLLHVLADVDVLHRGTDALAHRLVVQVAVGQADRPHLGREGKGRRIHLDRERIMTDHYLNHYLMLYLTI